MYMWNAQTLQIHKSVDESVVRQITRRSGKLRLMPFCEAAGMKANVARTAFVVGPRTHDDRHLGAGPSADRLH